MTKYIGRIYDVAVKIYPVTASGNGGDGCLSPALMSIIDAVNQQTITDWSPRHHTYCKGQQLLTGHLISRPTAKR